MLLCFTISAQKQNPPYPNKALADSVVIQKQKQGFFSFFKRLFHKNSQDEYVRKNTKNKADTGLSAKYKKPAPFELTKGSLTWTSLYTEGVNLNTGINGLYTLGRLSQGFDIYGAPISLQGIGVFNNGQFEKSYSSYSISFDPQAYLNNMKKRAEDILLNKKYTSKTPSLSDSLNAFESIRQKIQSPSYQTEENTNKLQFAKDRDSLQKHPGADTTELHSLRKKLSMYEQLEKRYQQLFIIKRDAGKLEKADSTEKKYQAQEKLLDNPNNVESLLEKNHQLSGYEKFLMGVQKFSIGQCDEEISEFTMHNFMMNGLNIGYKSGDIYTYVGYGKEVAMIDPFLMTGITIPNYNRTIEYTRIGEGSDNSSNFYATIIKIADNGINSLQESNWIFDLTKQIVIGKNLAFQAELAKSNYSYKHGEIDSALLPFNPSDNNTIAYALRGQGIIPDLNTTIKAEVSKTGGDFVTLGNSWLISGATKYEIDAIQPINKKLQLEIGGTHIIENTANPDNSRETNNCIHFSIIYKPTNLINMEFKYSPRQFQEEAGNVYANNITSNINQISFTSNISSEIFEKKTTTTLFIGNFQYSSMVEPSQLLSQNLNLCYYMLNELFLLSTTQGLNLSVNESRNNWSGSLSEFIGQAMYTLNIKKSFSFAVGPQWVEQPGVIPNGAGITSSTSSSIQKWGKIGIQVTYRNSIENPAISSSQYLLSGNISILW